MTRRILCVDDNVNITTLFTHTLSAMGHTVNVANDGLEAIARIKAAQFDVVIIDHQMSQITGLELVRYLREKAYSGKIFIFSGALSSEIIIEYEALKVEAIATKPTGFREILALLQSP